ncbi:pentapeptide repeat-containing protein [Gordonia sp. SMJS1]|uniref:pentapeptide repeat-containing protein n=1 Tax=Gordonia sp. SMJS1 TaxID=3039400 RepID=UPI002455676C|nr:pentapeptide repeat-containing protein [Gordonia sp. SMJS1]WGJ88180.1 pentapeptide repeat-containing protein [Gordonia sp. SMJS1]
MRPFAGLDLAEQNLRGLNLSRADLSDADLGGADLTRADLAGANLTNVNRPGSGGDRDLTRRIRIWEHHGSSTRRPVSGR